MGFSSSVLKYSRVRHFDLITSSIISAVVLLFVTGYDIANHDTYILPSYQCDDPSGPYYNSEFCATINGKTVLNIPYLNYAFEYTNRQNYWIWLNGLTIFLTGMLAFMRYAIGKSVLAGFMWGLTIILPVQFGAEDLIYFMGRGLEVPQTLPWLEGNIFINTVNQVVNAGGTITSTVLYQSIAAGLIILAIAWYLALRKRY